MSHFGNQEILVYSVNDDTSVTLEQVHMNSRCHFYISLVMFQTFPLHSSMDGIYFDESQGVVWAAGHPLMYKAIKVMADPFSHISPSQVHSIRKWCI